MQLREEEENDGSGSIKDFRNKMRSTAQREEEDKWVGYEWKDGNVSDGTRNSDWLTGWAEPKRTGADGRDACAGGKEGSTGVQDEGIGLPEQGIDLNTIK